jgi:DNA polymerase-3 subunit delta'
MAWDMIGHDWAVELLGRSVASGRVSHAYLFLGPPQVGKTSLALALARALNCTQPDAPCGRCASCTKIARNAHPDVRWVVGEGAGGAIKIDQIRALQREVALAPYEGRSRVYILERIDRASLEAANSLLKTLEEPPAHVVLVLTALHAEALPATVVSRCQRLDLRPVAAHRLEAALAERRVAPEQAALLARLSGGSVGWALAAAQDSALLAQRRRDLDRLVELLAAGRLARFEYAAKASQDGAAALQRLTLWITWWRDLLLVCCRRPQAVVNIDRLQELSAVARQASLAQALAGLQALHETAAYLEANVNTRLALEGLLLRLPRWQEAGAG